LKAAFDHDLVKARRKDQEFTTGSESGNIDKVKAIVEMLTGDLPEELSGTQIPWKDKGQDYDSSKGPDDLAYSPTVAFWNSQGLSFLRRTDDKKAYISPDLRKKPGDKDPPAFEDLSGLGLKWAVRIPFDRSATDKPLLTVEPPLYRLVTDGYSALSDSWRDRLPISTES
jgi:hypothetical protein